MGNEQLQNGFAWVELNSGAEDPQNLIGAGHEADGQPFFVARVKDPETGAIVPAKYGPTSGRGGLYTYGADEKYSGTYDLLTGDNNAIKWVDQNGQPNVSGFTPIPAGTDTDGKPLYFVTLTKDGMSEPEDAPDEHRRYLPRKGQGRNRRREIRLRWPGAAAGRLSHPRLRPSEASSQESD